MDSVAPVIELFQWSASELDIRALRTLSWKHDLRIATPPPPLISDDLDAKESCFHFGIRHEGHLIALLRVSIHAKYADIPYSKLFQHRQFGDSRCASTSRLVVHPEFRGKGLARQLELHASTWLKEQQIDETFGMIRSDRVRLAALQRQGYRTIEETTSEWFDGSIRETWLLSCKLLSGSTQDSGHINVSRAESLEHLQQALSVRMNAYHGAGKLLHWRSEDNFRDKFDDRSIIVVALSDACVVGTCRATYSDSLEDMLYPRNFDSFPLKVIPSKTAELSRAAVLQAYQGQGVVQRMLVKLAEICSHDQRDYLLAGSMTPHLDTYEKYGFARTGLLYRSIDIGEEHELITSAATRLLAS